VSGTSHKQQELVSEKEFLSETMKIAFFVASLAATASAFVPPSFGVQQKQQSNTAVFASVATSGASNMVSSTLPRDATVATVPSVAQRWRKSTKQVATLGPASSNKEMIEKLFLAGADVFRLNFSHGSQEQKKELLIMIREIEEKYSHPIAILGDLQGPKLLVSIRAFLSGCHLL
jgi:pyruvate kinase